MNFTPSTLLGPAEIAGFITGALLSPIFAVVADFKNARVFHPSGVTYRSQVTAVAANWPLDAVAQRLAGDALVRLSQGLGAQENNLPNLLGIAIRECGPSCSATAGGSSMLGEQDILTASSSTLIGIPLALFTTDVHDYFNNIYYAITPFDIGGAGLGLMRLVPNRVDTGAGTRQEKLDRAVEKGQAKFMLEVLLLRAATAGWLPVVEVNLKQKVAVDDAALRFDPYNAGRGIVPRGFVNGTRPAIYAASQFARAHYSPMTGMGTSTPVSRSRR